jgi:hypothetical protein
MKATEYGTGQSDCGGDLHPFERLNVPTRVDRHAVPGYACGYPGRDLPIKLATNEAHDHEELRM